MTSVKASVGIELASDSKENVIVEDEECEDDELECMMCTNIVLDKADLITCVNKICPFDICISCKRKWELKQERLRESPYKDATGNVLCPHCKQPYAEDLTSKVEYEYYDDDSVRYRGEKKNNKFHGFGALYDLRGKRLYSGYWRNGLYHGNGKLYSKGKLLYDGDWKQNKRNGYGILYNKSGQICYNGMWENGKRNGMGNEHLNSGKLFYEGQWICDKYHGYGTLYDSSNRIEFKGNFQRGKRHGEGQMFDNESNIFRKCIWKKGRFITFLD